MIQLRIYSPRDISIIVSNSFKTLLPEIFKIIFSETLKNIVPVTFKYIVSETFRMSMTVSGASVYSSLDQYRSTEDIHSAMHQV
jgi:hypothetical protein